MSRFIPPGLACTAAEGMGLRKRSPSPLLWVVVVAALCPLPSFLRVLEVPWALFLMAPKAEAAPWAAVGGFGLTCDTAGSVSRRCASYQGKSSLSVPAVWLSFRVIYRPG